MKYSSVEGCPCGVSVLIPYVISSTHKETPQLTSLLYRPLSLFPFPRALNMDTDGMASPAAQLCGTWLFTQWHLQRLIPKANQKQLIAKAFSRYLPTWRKLYWFSEGDSAVPNRLHSPPFPPAASCNSCTINDYRNFIPIEYFSTL